MVVPTPAASDGANMEQPETVPHANAQHAPAARRRVDNRLSYAVHCWAPGSAFADPSCNCLGEAAHPKLGARPTIRVIVGSWYEHRPGPFSRSSQSSKCHSCRIGAAPPARAIGQSMREVTLEG